MKQRNGFVSNSSSCSFIITNLTKKPLKLVEFVKENEQIVKSHQTEYECAEVDYNQEVMITCAKNRNLTLKPGKNELSFGDKDGDILGCVFDYSLRLGGKSKSFKWEFNKYLR